MFDIIVALTNSNSLIGIKEYGKYNIPWPYLVHDMSHYKRITMCNEVNVLIVGHNTWLSLPADAKTDNKRVYIVISRANELNLSKNSYLVNNFQAALDLAYSLQSERPVVIGGSAIYDMAMKHPDLLNMYVTVVYLDYPNDINVDERIYFPISTTSLDSITNSSGLDMESEQCHISMGTAISYSIRKYKALPGFNALYNRCDKLNMRSSFVTANEQKNPEEEQYLKLVQNVMLNGKIKKMRNSVTKSIFGAQLHYDLSAGYPLPTVKKSYPKSIFEELMWMIRGQTDVNILKRKGVHIWDKNSTTDFLRSRGLHYEEGDIGPGYGFQMRHYGATYIDCKTSYQGQGTDQLANCIKLINEDPHSRRIIIDLWNPSMLDQMALPPCHIMYHFSVDLYDQPTETGKKGKLNCNLFQRSWDIMLGWNTTTAALLTYILAHHCDMDPGMLVHSLSDVHLYQEHIECGAIDELLCRKPRKFPILSFAINKKPNIEDYNYSDIIIQNYYPCPAIKADMIA